jgi:hypothetical protein
MLAPSFSATRKTLPSQTEAREESVLNLVSRHEWTRLIQLDSKGPIIQRNDFELEGKVILPIENWELYRRLSLNPLIQMYNVLGETWFHCSLTPRINLKIK